MESTAQPAWLPFLLAILAIIFCQVVQWSFAKAFEQYVKAEWEKSADGTYDPIPNLSAETLVLRFNRDSDAIAVASVALATAPGIFVLFDHSSVLFTISMITLIGLPLSVILLMLFIPPTSYAHLPPRGLSFFLVSGISINAVLLILSLLIHTDSPN